MTKEVWHYRKRKNRTCHAEQCTRRLLSSAAAETKFRALGAAIPKQGVAGEAIPQAASTAGAASADQLSDEHCTTGGARPVSRTRKHGADVLPAGLSTEDQTAAPSPREHRPLPASHCGAQHLRQNTVCYSGSPCPRKQTLTSSCYSHTTWGLREGGVWALGPQLPPSHSWAQL